MNICRENLRIVEEGINRICNIFTDNKSWIYRRKIESRQLSALWVKPGQKPATVVKRGQYKSKPMLSIFFWTMDD